MTLLIGRVATKYTGSQIRLMHTMGSGPAVSPGSYNREGHIARAEEEELLSGDKSIGKYVKGEGWSKDWDSSIEEC